MILSDDHAAHAISAYGSVVNRTPRIDEIGARGVRFENCFVTNSLCSPSRASILTGTYSHVNGVKTLATPIDASQPTFVTPAAGGRLPDRDRRQVAHGRRRPVHDPQGFDYWDVLIEQGEYLDPRFLSEDGAAPGRAGLRHRHHHRSGARLGRAASRAMTPWCRADLPQGAAPALGARRRHAQGHVRRPDPGAGDLPRRLRDPDVVRATRRDADRRAPHRRGPQAAAVPKGCPTRRRRCGSTSATWRTTCACVASVDDNVGRVIDWLAARGEFDDTVLIYTSDQGFFLGDHGWFDKRFMYEESLRMPLVLSYPRRGPGRPGPRRHRHQRRLRADPPRRRRRRPPSAHAGPQLLAAT